MHTEFHFFISFFAHFLQSDHLQAFQNKKPERPKRGLTGIITGIGKEYHTIWVINANTKKMYLYRSTGENTNHYAVEPGLRFDNYDRFIVEYVDRCVVSSIESVQRDVKLDVVFSRIKDGELFTLDYMRLADDGNMSYHQMAFALAA